MTKTKKEKITKITAFKVFEADWTCRGFQFEVGKTFRHKGTVRACSSGFHACLKASDCFNYYSFDSSNKVALVEMWGATDTHDEDNKLASEYIKIVKELTWHEVLELVNTGKDNTGRANSGNGNSGDWNSGNRNSGNRNSGNGNSGNRNSGDWNSGDWNSGDWNSGNWNSGNRNSGNWNSGNRNSGNRNSGDWNSGDWNSGNRNSGNGNSGNRNSGNGNSGNGNSGNGNSGDWNSGNGNVRFFCSENQKNYVFNQPTDLSENDIREGFPSFWNYDTTLWISASDMSDEEKASNPHWEVTEGYLKTVSYKEMCQNGWKQDDDDNKLKFFNLPNFDLKTFEEITGINATDDFNRLMK